MENSITPFHPEKLKRGVSSDAVHPQSKYVSTHENVCTGTAITMVTIATDWPMYTPGT